MNLLLSIGGSVAVLGCGGGAKHASDSSARPYPVSRGPIEDSEPDDGVEVVSSHGHMDPAVVSAGVQPHARELTECFTSRIGDRWWLGGHVSVRWDIKKDGAVTAVRLAESDLGAWPVERCLLEVARSARFGKPIGGDAEFVVPLDFSVKTPATMWDEDRAIRAVGGQLASLDECAKREAITGGRPHEVTITLYVDSDGSPQSAGFSSSQVLDEGWADCAETTALGWRLADPRGAPAAAPSVRRPGPRGAVAAGRRGPHGTVAKLAIRYR